MKYAVREIIMMAVIVLLIFLLFKRCKNDSGLVKVQTTTVKLVDTIKGTSKIVYVPQPYAVHDTVEILTAVEVPERHTDLLEIKEEVPVKTSIPIRLYRDTLKFGSNGYAVLEDSIQGEILKRQMAYNIFQNTSTTEAVTKPVEKIKFFVGAEYFYPLNYTGAAIGLQLKNDNFLKGSFGYANGQKQYGISYFAKIKLRK